VIETFLRPPVTPAQWIADAVRALGTVGVVAAWSSVLDLYAAVSGWDLVVHFATTGLLAAALVVVAERAGIVPPGAPRSRRTPW
jgi:hypothetical protein